MKKNLFFPTIIGLTCLGISLWSLKKIRTTQKEAVLPSSIDLANDLVTTHGTDLTTEKVHSSFVALFEKREEHIRMDIANRTGIDPKIWMAIKTECIATFKKTTGKKVSAKTERIVKPILSDCGIDPQSIALFIDNQEHTPVATCSNSIHITEKAFHALEPLLQKFIISHESAHLVFQDAAEQEALIRMLTDDDGTLSESNQALVDSLSRFHEERADIFAMLNGKQYRDGAIASFTQWEKQYGNDTTPTHPTYRERSMIALAIDRTLLQCA